MTDYRSPLLDWENAVSAEGPDAAIAWHYGDPLREQRLADTGAGLFDQSNRDVLAVTGPDRLGWLHSICSQHVSRLSDGDSTQALVLSPNGHVEQHWQLTELSDQVWLDTEPGTAETVLGYLMKMRFMKRVEPAVITAEFAVLSLLGPEADQSLSGAGLPVPSSAAIPQQAPSSAAIPQPVASHGAMALPDGGLVRRRTDGGVDLIVRRPTLAAIAARLRMAGAAPVGTWAAEALRIVRREPRLGLDTDHRTLAHEVGWIGSAVHLNKGCYRGQETVARVQNLGKPPRRLVLLHLSGDSEQLPKPGTSVERDGRSVGFVGSTAHHYELGPIALAVVKRGVSLGDRLTVLGEPVAVDPEDAVAEFVEGFAGTAGPAQTSA